jgi:hypothetical protein
MGIFQDYVASLMYRPPQSDQVPESGINVLTGPGMMKYPDKNP